MKGVKEKNQKSFRIPSLPAAAVDAERKLHLSVESDATGVSVPEEEEEEEASGGGKKITTKSAFAYPWR